LPFGPGFQLILEGEIVAGVRRFKTPSAGGDSADVSPSVDVCGSATSDPASCSSAT